MTTDLKSRNTGIAMMIVGLVGIVAAAVWLFVVDEPFPMWLILAGGGLMFLGVGAGIRNRKE